jgi:hypothetical protein
MSVVGVFARVRSVCERGAEAGAEREAAPARRDAYRHLMARSREHERNRRGAECDTAPIRLCSCGSCISPGSVAETVRAAGAGTRDPRRPAAATMTWLS